jgi:hypothetical protein
VIDTIDKSGSAVDQLARTLLFEGYLLYPYRADSTKNRQRFNFGTLYPRTWCEAEASDADALQTEVLVATRDVASVAISVRFLHLLERDARDGDSWQEAREHAIELAPTDRSTTTRAVVPGGIVVDDGIDGTAPPCGGAAGRAPVPAVERRFEELAVAIAVTVTPEDGETSRIRVRIVNDTPVAISPEADRRVRMRHVQRFCLASTHVVFRRPYGGFVSLLEPPPALAAAAERCENVGAWPVLVGRPGATDAMLGSPIILYDYPAIAPESPTALFDATEIDEILALRVLTLSDAEKQHIRERDPRAKAILDRCEQLTADELAALHGAIRTRGSAEAFSVGDRVVARPGDRRADALDMLLAGKRAEIVAVERPIDSDEALFAVVFDDDPGRDLGVAGMAGHRFFFRAAELEVVP